MKLPSQSTDCSNGSRTDISSAYSACAFNNINDGDDMSSSTSCSMKFTHTEEHTTLFKSLGIQFSDENNVKDKQIQILSDKLIESDKKTSELEKEIERLRDIINKKRNE